MKKIYFLICLCSVFSCFAQEKTSNYITKYKDVAIIEMGASKPGEIEYICKITQPDMGIITNVYEAHIEYFGTIDAIAETKSALFNSLPTSGTAFVYIDDEVRQEHMSIKRSIEQDEQTDKQTVELLKEQLEYFKKQAETLQAQVAEQAHQFAEASHQMAEASQRHDTIVMKLSNTIEHQQLLLQEAQTHVPFWKKMFGLT